LRNRSSSGEIEFELIFAVETPREPLSWENAKLANGRQHPMPRICRTKSRRVGPLDFIRFIVSRKAPEYGVKPQGGPLARFGAASTRGFEYILY
jgi:hypothetical protein